MISQDGAIHFATELVALIDRFMQEYEQVAGPPASDLDRGLIIAYLLNVIRCDLELVGDCLNRQDVFGSLPPKRVLEECLKRDPQGMEQRREEVRRALYELGWLPLEKS